MCAMVQGLVSEDISKAFLLVSGVVAVVVAAADETSHAEARRAKPSQASQSRDRLTNGIGYICDDGSVIKHRAWLITNLQYQINPVT